MADKPKETKDLCAEIGALTTDKATELFGDKGKDIFREVSRVGGYGNVTDKQFQDGASLDLIGLSGTFRDAVNQILATK